jgi:NAD(P) transhydrogenase
MSATNSFDLVVIGSGPAGQKGAVAAAKLGKQVAVVDRGAMLGGVSLHSGTIPSKTLREVILYLTGFRQRSFYGKAYTLQNRIDAADLRRRVQQVVERQMQVVSDQLRRNGITVKEGAARFVDPHTVEVEGPSGIESLHAKHVLIGCGTRPARDPNIPFDGDRIVVADELEHLERLPRDALVVGAGVIGLEYASMMLALGVKVTIIEQRPTILDFVDHEIVEALSYHLRRLGAILRLGERVESVRVEDHEGSEPGTQHKRVVAHLESGKQVHGDWLLYTVGRQTNADLLNLAAAGLEADSRGRISVNPNLQTAVPHIYAAGDVIGFPALASTSMDQGRRASYHMFGAPMPNREELLAYGIYTIPEISMVGKTERQLTQEHIPYEIGVSKYEEIAKGQIAGDSIGMLKLLFHRDSLQLLGVHAMGENATELIHIGQAVLTFGGTIQYFRDNVFNYPTFAEAYKVAALDGLNRLR